MLNRKLRDLFEWNSGCVGRLITQLFLDKHELLFSSCPPYHFKKKTQHFKSNPWAYELNCHLQSLPVKTDLSLMLTTGSVQFFLRMTRAGGPAYPFVIWCQWMNQSSPVPWDILSVFPLTCPNKHISWYFMSVSSIGTLYTKNVRWSSHLPHVV